MTNDHVAPQNPALHNSPKATADASAETKGVELAAAESCYWNDKKYSDGATVCDAHHRHKCWNGRWVDISNC